MKPIVRSVVAVVVGLVAGGVLVAAVEAVGHRVYPLPEGADPYDRRAMAALLADAPAGALLFVLAAWAAGALGGAWLAAWLAGRAPLLHGLIIGSLLLLAGVANLVALPHPLWFTIVGPVVFLPAAWLGARLAGDRTSLAGT